MKKNDKRKIEFVVNVIVIAHIMLILTGLFGYGEFNNYSYFGIIKLFVNLNPLQQVIIICIASFSILLIFSRLINKTIIFRIALILLIISIWTFSIYFYEMISVNNCENLFDCDTPFYIKNMADVTDLTYNKISLFIDQNRPRVK